MNQAQDPEWLKHLFRYEAQQRASASTDRQRPIGANDIEVVKVAAALSLSAQRPSLIRIAAESSTFLSEPTVRKCVDKLCALGVLHRRGADLTPCSHDSWLNYSADAPDPVGLDRHVAGFLKDLEGRLVDLARRQPQKRQA